MDLAQPQTVESIDAGPEPAFRKHWRGWAIVWMFAVILVAFYFVQVVVTLGIVFVRFGASIRDYALTHSQEATVAYLRSPELLARMLDPATLFVIQLASTVALVGLTLYLSRDVLSARLPDLGLGRALTWRTVLVGVLAGLVLLVLSATIEALQDRLVGAHPQAILQVFMRHHGSLAFILDVGSVAVLAPFAEELFFRGFLFTGLVQRMQLGVAALLSGVLFGAAHLDFYNILPLSVLGTGLAFVYYRTGTLWTNIVAHATINGSQLALIFLFPHLAK